MINFSGNLFKYGYLGNLLTLKEPFMEKEEKDCINSVESFEETGFNYTLSLISGKYKLTILYALYRHKVIRFNQLQKYLKMISHKTLSNVLKELEADDLITRKEYPQIPPKVEYSLSEKGKSLIPILYSLCEWGEKHKI